MLDMGCHEVSLGDTIGVGTPRSTRLMLEEVMVRIYHCTDSFESHAWKERRSKATVINCIFEFARI